MLADSEFLFQFEQHTLPPEYFDHRGHLRLAWLYLCQYDVQQASALTATGIHGYASSLGAKDKFHYTLTEAIVQIMAARMQSGPGESLQEFLDANPDLVADFSGLLLQHYSGSLLFSDKAKTAWVEPDLKPLPLVSGEKAHVHDRQTG